MCVITKKTKVKIIKINTGKKKPKTGPKKPKNKQMSAGMPAKEMSVHPCTLKYMMAITNPWDPRSYGSCVPVDNMNASQKSHVFFRKTITIGAGGYAIFGITPTVANDIYCMFSSNDLWTGVGQTVINFATMAAAIPAQGTAEYIANPYTYSQCSDTGASSTPSLVRGRIVGGGLRWFYQGTELNRAGFSAPFVSPDHDTIEGLSIDSIISWPSTHVIPNSGRQRHQASVYAIRNSEHVYPIATQGGSVSEDAVMSCSPFSSQKAASYSAYSGAPIACVIFHGVVGSTWQVEYCQHNEYVGQPCSYMATKNSSDPEGANLVAEAITDVQQDSSTEVSFNSVMNRLKRIKEEEWKSMINLGSSMFSAARGFTASQPSNRLRIGNQY